MPGFPWCRPRSTWAAGRLVAARADVRRAAGRRAAPATRDLAHFRAATSAWPAWGAQRTAAEAAAPEDPALAALSLAGRGAVALFRSARRVRPRTPSATPRAPGGGARRGPRPASRPAPDPVPRLIGAAALNAGDTVAPGSGRSRDHAPPPAGHGWQDSPWTAGAHAVLAHACLMRRRPARALQVAVDGLRIPPTAGPAVRFALRSRPRGALFDIGNRPAGLLELQEAHAELGGDAGPRPLAATAALLEHRAALVLGLPGRGATSVDRLAGARRRRGRVDAHAGVVRGRRRLRRGWPARRGAAAGRTTLRPVLPSTLVEAWLVEVWGALGWATGPARRQALQAALPSPSRWTSLRPFALAGQGIRVLLVDQLGGIRDPADFAFRCLSARPRWAGHRHRGLSAREQDVLTQLVSLSNLGRDRRRPRRVGEHDQEPRPGDLRQARREHPPRRRTDGTGTRAADMTWPEHAPPAVPGGGPRVAPGRMRCPRPGGPPRVPATKIAVPAAARRSSPPARTSGTGWTRPPPTRSSWSAPRPGSARPSCSPTGCAGAGPRSRPGSPWTPTTTTPGDFWSAVVAALLELPALSGDAGAGRLRDLIARPRSIDVVTDFVEALDASPSPCGSCWTTCTNSSAGRSCATSPGSFSRRPSGLQLVLASRADPPISVPRLRLEDALHELRADALRFTLEDTAALLEGRGLELPPGSGALHARTEGWVAGLRLAALALRRTDDALGFLAHFSGDERSVADYLTGEILDAAQRGDAGLPAPGQRLFTIPAALAANCRDGRMPAGCWTTSGGRRPCRTHRRRTATASTPCCAPT